MYLYNGFNGFGGFHSNNTVYLAYLKKEIGSNTVFYTSDFINWKESVLPVSIGSALNGENHLFYLKGIWFAFIKTASDSATVAWTKNFLHWDYRDDLGIKAANPLVLRTQVDILTNTFLIGTMYTTVGSNSTKPLYYNSVENNLELSPNSFSIGSYQTALTIDMWSGVNSMYYSSSLSANTVYLSNDGFLSYTPVSVPTNASSGYSLCHVPNASTPFYVNIRTRGSTSAQSYTGTALTNLAARTTFVGSNPPSTILNNAKTKLGYTGFGSTNTFHVYSSNGNPVSTPTSFSGNRIFTKNNLDAIYCLSYTNRNDQILYKLDDNFTTKSNTPVQTGTYLYPNTLESPVLTYNSSLNKVIATFSYYSAANSEFPSFATFDADDISQKTIYHDFAASRTSLIMGVRYD